MQNILLVKSFIAPVVGRVLQGFCDSQQAALSQLRLSVGWYLFLNRTVEYTLTMGLCHEFAARSEGACAGMVHTHTRRSGTMRESESEK